MEDPPPAASAMASPRRLASLDDARAALMRCLPPPVAPRRMAANEAAASPGAVLAQTLVAPTGLPAAARAERDGWAVAALDTQGAAPQSPAPLAQMPPRVARGDAMPPGTDAVLGPFDLLREFGMAQAIQPVAPGDGVRGPGEDIAAGAVLREAGESLRATDLAALSACGIASVETRSARIAWIPVGDEIVADPSCDRTGPVLAALAARAGIPFDALPAVPDAPAPIAAALRAATAGHDLLMLGGGTGEGLQDVSAAGLAAAGTVHVHGIGLQPGASAGFGLVGTLPALLVPGSLEDAIAIWFALARPAIDALTAAAPRPPRRARLARKLASAVGIAELAALAIDAEGRATPLAVGGLPLAALAAADGLALVPAAAEGYEAGSEIEYAPL